MGVVFVVVLLAYVAVTEALDWLGRMELIEAHWPKVGSAIASRKLRVLLLLLGIGLLVKVVLEPRPVPSSRPGTKSDQAAKQEPTSPPAVIPQPSFDAQMVLPDGRAIISTRPEDLQAFYHSSTTDHFNRVLGGKWVKMSVKIEDNWGDGLVLLDLTSPQILIQFGRGWVEQLSVLPRGSSVTVRCKVSEARITSIKLAECELL